MEIVILAVKLAAVVLVVYGGCLCLWHRATERGSDERPVRSPRNLRLIHEMGELLAAGDGRSGSRQ